MVNVTELQYAKTSDLCEIYGVSSRTIANWRKEGLPYEKIGKRLVRYNIKEVDQWLKSRQ